MKGPEQDYDTADNPSAEARPDGTSVFREVDGVTPVMQMRVTPGAG